MILITRLQKTLNDFQRFDILFNNAGICAHVLTHGLTTSELGTMRGSNLKEASLLLQRQCPG
jgi:NADP-dependent 3-hydroxy acid dehydrogenase YdfG